MSLVTCTGSLTIRERIAIPPGAVATVKVVDTAGEVLAATALEAEGVPVDFSVTIDPELANGDLLVWAMLRTEVGVWGTLELAAADQESVVLGRIED